MLFSTKISLHSSLVLSRNSPIEGYLYTSLYGDDFGLVENNASYMSCSASLFCNLIILFNFKRVMNSIEMRREELEKGSGMDETKENSILMTSTHNVEIQMNAVLTTSGSNIQFKVGRQQETEKNWLFWKKKSRSRSREKLSSSMHFFLENSALSFSWKQDFLEIFL